MDPAWPSGQMWMLWYRGLAPSMSTRRASAKARKMARPRRFTTVMSMKTDDQEPVDSIRYPAKYTMMTPEEIKKKNRLSSAKKRE